MTEESNKSLLNNNKGNNIFSNQIYNINISKVEPIQDKINNSMSLKEGIKKKTSIKKGSKFLGLKKTTISKLLINLSKTENTNNSIIIKNSKNVRNSQNMSSLNLNSFHNFNNLDSNNNIKILSKKSLNLEIQNNDYLSKGKVNNSQLFEPKEKKNNSSSTNKYVNPNPKDRSSKNLLGLKNTINIRRNLSNLNLININKTQRKNIESISDDNCLQLVKYNKIQIYRNDIYKSKDNFEENKNIMQNFNVFEEPKFKNKYKLLQKMKIYSLIQSVSALLSILFCIIDLELYNKYSYSYISENNIKYEKFYEIKLRKINSYENLIRIFNGIFSFVCALMTIYIYYQKLLYIQKEEKKNLNHRNNFKNKNIISYQLINNINERSIIKSNQSISQLLIRILINIIFYPPKLNFCFYYYNNKILCIYPFQSFILLNFVFKII